MVPVKYGLYLCVPYGSCEVRTVSVFSMVLTVNSDCLPLQQWSQHYDNTFTLPASMADDMSHWSIRGETVSASHRIESQWIGKGGEESFLEYCQKYSLFISSDIQQALGRYKRLLSSVTTRITRK
jgi:hypothetical protein